MSNPKVHQSKKGVPSDEMVITMHPDSETMTRQNLPYIVGVTNKTCGSRALSMNMVVIPPGGKARPHYHNGYETAVYIVSGKVETRYGIGLKQSVINKAGDFLYIPANVPHQPVNLSQTEPVYALAARNDPNEQESVVLFDIEK